MSFQIFKYICSFEAFFVLWLFSYQFKNLHRIFQHPDITFILTLVVVPWALFLFLRTPSNSSKKTVAIIGFSSPLIIFALFSAYSCLSSLWSISDTYTLSKMMCYVVYIIPGFLMTYFVIAKEMRRVNRLLILISTFAVLVECEVLREFWIYGFRFVTLGADYLVTGQTIGAGFLVLLAYSLHIFFSASFPKLHQKSYLIATVLGATLFYVLINLGGRGPVLAVGLSFILLYFLNGLFRSYSLLAKHFYIFVFIFLGVFQLFNNILKHSTPLVIERATKIFDQNFNIVDTTLTLRIEYYISACKAFLNHFFFGLGFGGWPVFHGLGEVRWHPHNILLEILAETGIVGFALFIWLLWAVFRKFSIKLVIYNLQVSVIFIVFVFSFINAMKTGDIVDNILLFVTLALLSGMAKFHKLEEKSSGSLSDVEVR